jgi:hypothetical protein
MTDARVHEPKLAALRAYVAGELRPAARERLERHLAACETCDVALVGLRRYAALAPIDDALPSIDWARMEAAIDREEVRAARLRRTRTLSWIGAGLAAAAAVLIALRPPSPVAERAAPRPPAQASHAPAVEPATAARLRAMVSAIVGSPRASDAMHASTPLTLDAQPLEGWTLETGAGSEVHVALAGAGAFILRENSRLELRALRPEQVELVLVRGQVVSQVLPRRAEQRYEVLAGDRRVRVHGTRFGVASAPESLAVQVDEGVVDVLAGDGALLAELHAPQRWIQEGARAGRLRRAAERLPHPRVLEAASAQWPVLAVPAWPAVVQWQIDGADTATGDALQMRVPPGRVPIVGRLADGRTLRGELSADAVGARVDPAALRLVTPDAPAAAPRDSAGSLDSDSASSVIRASQPALQRCYERSMREQAPGAASIVKVRLRIAIDARGGVRSVELEGADAAPADLAACIRQVARGWRFAAPGGGGVTFEAPLRFRPLH